MSCDVVIVGGGPAGLPAALTLGRSRKRVLLCDSGRRRNAAAAHIHNFVARDGTPPEEFRQIARAQLAAYTSVEVRDARVVSSHVDLVRSLRVALDDEGYVRVDAMKSETSVKGVHAAGDLTTRMQGAIWAAAAGARAAAMINLDLTVERASLGTL